MPLCLSHNFIPRLCLRIPSREQRERACECLINPWDPRRFISFSNETSDGDVNLSSSVLFFPSPLAPPKKGRNSPANEPWPDVIGVVVIFIVTGMFMLGLENTRIFGLLMTAGVLLVGTLIVIITGLRGNPALFRTEPILPKGVVGVSEIKREPGRACFF